MRNIGRHLSNQLWTRTTAAKRLAACASALLVLVPFAGFSEETETYEYDALGRLVRVERGPEEHVDYEYDAAGNRIATTSPASPEEKIVMIVYDGITIPIVVKP